MDQRVCVVNIKGMFPEVYGPFADAREAAAWALIQKGKKISILPLAAPTDRKEQP